MFGISCVCVVAAIMCFTIVLLFVCFHPVFSSSFRSAPKNGPSAGFLKSNTLVSRTSLSSKSTHPSSKKESGIKVCGMCSTVLYVCYHRQIVFLPRECMPCLSGYCCIQHVTVGFSSFLLKGAWCAARTTLKDRSTVAVVKVGQSLGTYSSVFLNVEKITTMALYGIGSFLSAGPHDCWLFQPLKQGSPNVLYFAAIRGTFK